MALYNLNDALKKKASEAVHDTSNASETGLDNINRVKILSPGRQVFKRFIRNRLAVFGTVLLLVLFVLCFLGPLVYPYGQKEVFYKYDYQQVDYAQAKNNTSFTGIVIDSSVKVNTNANSMMTTNIKTMKAAGLDRYYMVGEDGCAYEIDRLDDNIYTLGQGTLEHICKFGTNRVKVCDYDSIKNEAQFVNGYELGADFNMTAKKSCKGTSGEFEFDGQTYEFEKGNGKSYVIFCDAGGFIYTAASFDAGFEQAAEAVAEADDRIFEYDGGTYFVTASKGSYEAYKVSDVKVAKVFTTFVMDTYETGANVSDEFKVGALINAFGAGEFDADGHHYTIKNDGEEIVVFDSEGKEYAEFTTFIIRRSNGEDTVEYSLKKALAEAIEAMTASGQHETGIVHSLPRQDAEGQYSYDADGQLLYDDTEIHITQKDTGMYVINCNQIIYLIDRFASPSLKHIFGTDGDGFDVFARIMYGGRVSLMVGFVVVFIETLLGVIMGGLAGYYGGWVDNVIMRLVDIFYCLPSLPIMIILGAMMDAMRLDTYIRLLVMMAMLGVLGWAGVARLVRGQILSLREQEFMVAAEATGIKVRARIFKHLVPNVMPQLIVSATMGIGGTILTESTLSFLGLGVKHPLATWGTMINSVSSASAMAHYAYIWIPVGILISLTVIAFNFVGDGLRDAYDPKSKR